jgi:hypothetical protein
MTQCDMQTGPCSCGAWHQREDETVGKDNVKAITNANRNESCSTCRFFERFDSDDYGEGAGTCRRYPPQISSAMLAQLAKYQKVREFEDPGDDAGELWDTMLQERHDTTNWQFPTVSESNNDWCGEYQEVRTQL